jgi:hypothetical protein
MYEIIFPQTESVSVYIATEWGWMMLSLKLQLTRLRADREQVRFKVVLRIPEF